MRVHCIIVLFFVMKNVFSSSTSREKRQTQPNLTLDSRRHRVSQLVPFPDFTETIKQIDCFPETEYLTSVLETKPFFYQSNDILEPFQDDVKSSFKSIATEINKPKVFPTIKPKPKTDVKKVEQKQKPEQEPATPPNNATKILEDKSKEHVDFDDKISTKTEFTSIEDSTVHDDVNSQMADDNSTKILEDKSKEHVDFDDETSTTAEFTSIEHSTAHDDVNSQMADDNATKTFEDKSNEHVDYDFDDEIATVAEFTSIEHSTAHDDVNSQMAADDSFPEVSDETFYSFDASNASKVGYTITSSSSNTTEEYEDQVSVPLLLSETEEEPIIFG